MEILQRYFCQPENTRFLDAETIIFTNNLVPEEQFNRWKRVFQHNIRSQFASVVDEYNEFWQDFRLNARLYFQVVLADDGKIDYGYDYMADFTSHWDEIGIQFDQFLRNAEDWRRTGHCEYTRLSIPFMSYRDKQLIFQGSNNHAYYRNLSIEQIVPFENQQELPLYQLSFQEDDIEPNESGMSHSTFVFYELKVTDFYGE